MTITGRKKYTYVEIDIELINGEKVTLHQRQYLEECLEYLREDVITKVATPAQRYWFDVKSELEKLSKEKQEIFHSIVQKLLFSGKRYQPNLQNSISFLCTRVRSSIYRIGINLKKLQ